MFGIGETHGQPTVCERGARQLALVVGERIPEQLTLPLKCLPWAPRIFHHATHLDCEGKLRGAFITTMESQKASIDGNEGGSLLECW